jgi:ABC-2 type transport system permease protein
MSFSRLWAILRKEFRHIYRDKRTLFLVTLSPAIMLLTLSYLFALEVSKVKLGVWDLDQSATSRALVNTLTFDGKFVNVEALSSYDSIREALMRGDIKVALVIPSEMEADLIAGRHTPVQAIMDGTDSVTVASGLALLRTRITAFNAKIAVAGTQVQPPVTLNTQAWFNRELKSTLSMVPGLIPLVLIMPSLAMALAMTREKELGSFETLATTPVRGLEYLLGKLIPYITYGLISAAIAILLALVWFQVPLRGRMLDLVLFTFLYLFASLGMSVLISSFLANQGTAMRVVLFVFFVPSFFLAGIILPVDTRSGISQAVSFVLPATQFVQMTRGVFLKGLGVDDLVMPTLVLIILGTLTVLGSLLLFKKQVDY